MSQLELPTERPGDEPDDVLFGSIYGVRSVELNRPNKMNSLNASMARKILPRLKVSRLPCLGICFCPGLHEANGEAHRNGKAPSSPTW